MTAVISFLSTFEKVFVLKLFITLVKCLASPNTNIPRINKPANFANYNFWLRTLINFSTWTMVYETCIVPPSLRDLLSKELSICRSLYCLVRLFARPSTLAMVGLGAALRILLSLLLRLNTKYALHNCNFAEISTLDKFLDKSGSPGWIFISRFYSGARKLCSITFSTFQNFDLLQSLGLSQSGGNAY